MGRPSKGSSTSGKPLTFDIDSLTGVVDNTADNTTSSPTDTTPSTTAAASPSSFTDRTTDTTVKRFAIPLTQDDKIDLNAMGERATTRLKKALATTEMKKALGLLDRQEILPHSKVKELVGFVGDIEAFAAHNIGKFDQDLCKIAFTFDDDERGKLADSLKPLIDKYAAKLEPLIENIDEWKIGLSLVMMSFAKYRYVVLLQDERKLAQTRPNGHIGHTPQRNM